MQPLGLDVVLDQLGQARLVDRNLAAVERVDLRLVDIDAGDVVAAVGEAGAGDQADVAGANDCNFHDAIRAIREDGAEPLQRPGAAGTVAGGTRYCQRTV